MNEQQYPCLYHLTVRRPDIITSAVVCRFSPGIESIAMARGQFLEVFELNDNAELELRGRTNCFANIRCLERVSSLGSSIDRLVIASDSGNLAIVEFNPVELKFNLICYENIAPPKLRHEFPGEYLAVDPHGRAVLAASISNLRSVVLVDDKGIKSSPIVAPMPSLFCYSAVALDCGYENPAFAFIERFRFGKKNLALYEFNLGLNHLIKEWSHEVPDDCNYMVPIPGGRDGPSGLLTFTDTSLAYWGKSGVIRSEAKLIEPIACAAVIETSQVTFSMLMYTNSGGVSKLYFDGESLFISSVTIDISDKPAPSSLSIFKSGHIFLNCSSGNHYIFQINELDPLELVKTGELTNIAPVANSILSSRKLIVGCGHSAETSRLSLVQFGIDIEELASTPLPSVPRAVFTTKRQAGDSSDGLIILAFNNNTTTLAISEDGAVEEVSEAVTGISSNLDTLGVSGLVAGIVQVHTKGLRYINYVEKESLKVIPWLAPTGSKIVSCAFSPTQVAIALNNNLIIYFEEVNGSLMESQHHVAQSSNVCAMSFSSNPTSIKSIDLYVALTDMTLRQFSVPQLKQKKLFSLNYLPTSVIHCYNKLKSSEQIYVGHVNGTVSEIEENITFIHVVGSLPVHLRLATETAVIAISSRVWLFEGKNTASPLLGTTSVGLADCCKFSPEGENNGGYVIGIKESQLEVFNLKKDLEKVGSLSQDGEPFGIPPCSIAPVKSPGSENFYVVLQDGTLCLVNDSMEKIHSIETDYVNPTAAVNVRFDSQKKEYLAIAFGDKIAIFEYNRERSGVEFLHETSLESRCYALLPFRGQLLAGIQNQLFLFDMGQKQLLRQDGILLTDLVSIRTLKASRNLVYVGDVRRSVTVLNYGGNGFKILAVDPVTRAANSMILLDLATVCIGDHFGNIAILRFPGVEHSHLTEQKQLLQLVACYWLPDSIIGLHRGTLSPVSTVESIVYVGIQGSIGILTPFISKSEYDFMSELECHLSSMAFTSILGQDITKISNYYFPRKSVINGDVYEYLLGSSNDSELQELAKAADSTVLNIISRIKAIKNRSVRWNSMLINK